MTVLGIVGVGTYADYTVRGIRHGGWAGEILLSPRNAEMAASLASDCGCRIMPDNQSVVDGSDWILPGVRPAIVEEVLASLSFRDDQTLISGVAGTSIDRLRASADSIGQVIRIMPVNAARAGGSPTMMYPYVEEVAVLLQHCGTVVAAKSEREFDIGTTLACVYGWYFALFDEITKEAEASGLSPETSRAMTLGLARAAADISSFKADQELSELVDYITPEGSFTRLGLDHLRARDAFAPWVEAMRLLQSRL